MWQIGCSGEHRAGSLWIELAPSGGMAEAAVARPTGASVRSVRRSAREPAVTTGETAASIATQQVGRPASTAAWATTIQGWLPEDRALPGVEIVRRLHEVHGYRRGKSAVYGLRRRVRAPALAPLVRFESAPGEFSQHDFGQVEVRYRPDAGERLHFCAGRPVYRVARTGIKGAKLAATIEAAHESSGRIVYLAMLESFERVIAAVGAVVAELKAQRADIEGCVWLRRLGG